MRDAATNGDGGAAERRRPSPLEADLDRLEAVDPRGLTAVWAARFGSPPPAALPPRFLRLALAHDVQAKAIGGVTPALERRPARIAAGTDANEKAKPVAPRLKPGTVVLRDWGGRSWRVKLLDNGAFGFEGRRWRSLSAIARRITGTSRNGPAFFGLRSGGSHGAA